MASNVVANNLVEALERSRQELLDAVAGVDEARARLRPEPDRWNVIDCVEHITVSEELFLAWIGKAAPAEAPELDRSDRLRELMAGRRRRVIAPEPVRPSSRFATLIDAVQAFEAVRARTLDLARRNPPELHATAIPHPFVGTVTGAELLAIMAGHASRHTAQIREVLQAG